MYLRVNVCVRVSVCAVGCTYVLARFGTCSACAAQHSLSTYGREDGVTSEPRNVFPVSLSPDTSLVITLNICQMLLASRLVNTTESARGMLSVSGQQHHVCGVPGTWYVVHF